MSSYEQPYAPPLQGISQQIPKERLPGQVQAQLNMLSDPVTGLRRRPEAKYVFNINTSNDNTPADSGSLKAWFVDIAGYSIHVILNCKDRRIWLLDTSYNVITTLAGGSYLTAVNPNMQGCYYVVAGAFNKEYSVTITTSAGSQTKTYTTPDGTAVGHAAQATPDYIANQIKVAFDAVAGALGITLYIQNAYVYIKANTGVTVAYVNSSTGGAYIMPSKDSYFTQVSNLPALLPTQADGYIVRVGDIRLPQYYQYQASSASWLESGAFGSPTSLTNMPPAITYSGSWSLVAGTFEGRFAGDETSNPTHRFITHGITGISTFQGRLVFLSGAFCSMSASNKPRRFYRTTVTSILESDPIEVGSSANSSAAYEYAIPFMKDLILFSARYQAIIPAGSQAITSRTATVVPTSTHAADMTCMPALVGRTLMYPVPRSADYFGVFEMVPSQYTDSQYTSVDSTQHVPKFMGGRCRFGVSSGVSGIALFAPSGDFRTLIVHEYLWDETTKQQQAWHQWTFAQDVAQAYFSGEVINLLFCQNGRIVGTTMDPRAGALTEDSGRRPLLDMYIQRPITDHVVTLPAWLTAFDPLAKNHVTLASYSGALAGEKVGYTVSGTD